ncbi:MAG: 1-deoxy-D-xylulose-5-phosphate reductoisomerase [Gammaproteobacteria bacterium]|nr:MAG: 1-deoxy-D-xylulose-5-phosphate reductoisomerase [Gammaproteobacteria bacterium]
MSNLQDICILGSTGSIGVSTLSVIEANQSGYNVVALTANKNRQKLFEQCLKYKPRYAVMKDIEQAGQLEKQLQGHNIEVLAGDDGLEAVAALEEVDTVMCAIVGAAGLASTLSAARAGKKVLLANKEALVMSGALFMDEIKQNNATLIPIDSEHNAIFQCLPSSQAQSLIQGNCSLTELGIEKILLTGSGGPFRQTPLEQLSKMTPDQACDHPNWSMGRKISVDSATMMNKGLEFIEAHWLFSASVEQIEIIVHPQSVVHSMVHYRDGSVLALLGLPDMRTPIAHGLAYPNRIESNVQGVNFTEISALTFEPTDEARFPCIRIAREALEAGGAASTVLNAANEVAVDAFLTKRIKFTDIASLIDTVLNKMTSTSVESIAAVMEADAWARVEADHYLARTVN